MHGKVVYVGGGGGPSSLRSSPESKLNLLMFNLSASKLYSCYLCLVTLWQLSATPYNYHVQGCNSSVSCIGYRILYAGLSYPCLYAHAKFKDYNNIIVHV